MVRASECRMLVASTKFAFPVNFWTHSPQSTGLSTPASSSAVSEPQWWPHITGVRCRTGYDGKHGVRVSQL